jgi:plastocyanin
VELGSLRSRVSALAALVVTGLFVVAAPAHAAPSAAKAQTGGAAAGVSIVAGVNDPDDPNIAVLEYLPAKVKVAVGANVTWQIAGPEPHSVTFVPDGSPAPSADTDPSLFGPTPPTGPYDGTTTINSGVLPQGESQQVSTFTASFAKTGTYTYYCVIHPNMVGTLQVVDKGADTQQQITKAGNQQKAKYLKEGEAAKKKLTSATPAKKKNSDGSTTYSVEMGASTAHTDVLAFSPTPRNVKAGDHVTFVNNSAAPHTASFGGSLVPTIPVLPDVQHAVPGPSPQSLSQGVYLNTGWLPPKTKQGPPLSARSYTYDVPAAGKYTYVCVLHLPSGMAAEIDAT